MIPPKTKNPKKTDKTYFFAEKIDENGNLKEIVINHFEFCETLKSMGFGRYDIPGSDQSVFVYIRDNVVKQVNPVQIADILLEWLKGIDYEKAGFEVLRYEHIANKIYKGITSYTNPAFLARMTLDKEVIMNQDTKDVAYLYFKNGFVSCTPQSHELHPYSEMKEYIWQSQILQRDFTKLDTETTEKGQFSDFVFKVAGENQERFESLCSIIGYNLHRFTDMKMKATVLTDSRISENPEGRTGKTLLCKSFAYVRNYCELNGKDFKPEEKHKYQKASIDTHIICLNDVRKNFDIECLFNDITEGIQIEKKNQDPFTVKAKMIVTTNMTMIIDGASAKDRTIEFEFSDYFSDKRSPQDVYKCWFFTEWDEAEWSRFYNFMAICLCQYLCNGIIKADPINLNMRKLLDQTAPEFVNWMRDKEFKPNVEHSKKDLYEDFKKDYEDFAQGKFTQRKFTTWLKVYARFSAEFGDFQETRSNNKDYIIFLTR